MHLYPYPNLLSCLSIRILLHTVLVLFIACFVLAQIIYYTYLDGTSECKYVQAVVVSNLTDTQIHSPSIPASLKYYHEDDFCILNEFNIDTSRGPVRGIYDGL